VSTEAEYQPWWRFFGPWPLQPLPIGGIAALLSVALGLKDGLWLEQGVNLFAGLATLIAVSGIFAISKRFAPEMVAHPLGYVLVLVSTATIVTAIRETAGVIPGSQDPVLRIASAIVLGTLFFAFLQGVLGSSQGRLRRENERASRAVTELREQQQALLKADEAVRQQVAVVLHDHVQAGLVSACLRLQVVRRQKDSPAEQQREVAEVIAQLEQLRALDLRRAVRALSPNLRDVDMQTVLEELADSWAPAIDVATTVVGELPRNREVRLGIYRIAEQGLLNVAAHARAQRCEIGVGVDEDIVITVDDDGIGVPSDVTPGLGSTLIETWCRTLGGSWGWQASPLGGARLRAVLPLSAVSA
jgi:glucose-6-phosphate-specific signal transduction histidine kinase